MALDAYNNASAACLRNVRRLLQVIEVQFLFHDIHMRKLITIFSDLGNPSGHYSISRTLVFATSRSEHMHSRLNEGRLNGLASTRVHSDKEVPSDEIIDDFAKMKARRLKVAI